MSVAQSPPLNVEEWGMIFGFLCEKEADDVLWHMFNAEARAGVKDTMEEYRWYPVVSDVDNDMRGGIKRKWGN